MQFAGVADGYNRFSYVMNNPMRFTDPSGYMSQEEWDEFIFDLWSNTSRYGYWEPGMGSVRQMSDAEARDVIEGLGGSMEGYWRQSGNFSGGFTRLPSTVTGRGNGKPGREVHPIVWTPLNYSPGGWYFVSTWSAPNHDVNGLWGGGDDGIYMGWRGPGDGGGPGLGSRRYPDDEIHRQYERQRWLQNASGRLEYDNTLFYIFTGAKLVKWGIKLSRALKLSKWKELNYTTKQLGKKFGEHKSDLLPGYRTVEEYLELARTMYNSKKARVMKFSDDATVYAGETHYFLDGNLLRLDKDGAFRTLYRINPIQH